jgi:thymidylate synthase
MEKGEEKTGSVKVYQDSRGIYIVNKASEGELPKIGVFAETLPQAYELALISLWENGTDVRTHYDRKDNLGNYIDPPSREATVSINIDKPFQEPRIHKLIPGHFESLENYRQEVVDGIHDSWIIPGDTYWTYTYAERLFNYNPSTDLNAPDRGLLLPRGINQIEKIVDDLERDITSKGAQATTWMPSADPGLESNRPCLQRIWFRAYEEKDGSVGLNANWYFRSRDVKAWFMNFWALSDLVKHTGELLEQRIEKPVHLRRISDTSDSLHFYGSYFKEFEERDFKRVKPEEGFENRIMSSEDERFLYVIEEEKKKLGENPHYNKNIESQEKLAKRIAQDRNASERDKEFVKKLFPQFIEQNQWRKTRTSWYKNHEHFMGEPPTQE